jgi:N-acetylglucosamine-6-phosphate deacetylase
MKALQNTKLKKIIEIREYEIVQKMIQQTNLHADIILNSFHLLIKSVKLAENISTHPGLPYHYKMHNLQNIKI